MRAITASEARRTSPALIEQVIDDCEAIEMGLPHPVDMEEAPSRRRGPSASCLVETRGVEPLT